MARLTQTEAPPLTCASSSLPDPTGQATPHLLPLRASRLVYGVNGTALIRGIDLTLEAGPRTVIMGANGAGKSLLLRLLHGLLRPTSGTIAWGQTGWGVAVRRRQAMVFQRPVLLRRSVRANLRFALELRPAPSKDRSQRLARLLELAGLSAVASRPARVLSAGEQQRLALVRALSLEPEVLLLDEPTASLDPAAVAAIENLIHTADSRGAKIMLVTHDIGQARRIADEVVFVHHGRIAEHTPAEEFFRRPRSEPARAYLEGRLVL